MSSPDPRVGPPRVLASVTVGAPSVTGAWHAINGVPAGPTIGTPRTVDPWGQVGPAVQPGRPSSQAPVSVPLGGGARPAYEGMGPPPDFITGAQVGDYYLDILTGYLYRLGSA